MKENLLCTCVQRCFQQAKCFFAELIMQMEGNVKAWLCHCKHSEAIQKRYGFSLVEMLMALLVASLLLAALAPVMTKKMNEVVNFEGKVENPVRHKVVYLTDVGDGEWTLPNGIRTFNVTTVAGGGGGGAGSNYGCVVFTTTATPSGSLLGKDNEYCEHVRSDGNANFTIPEGINELYISMISGAGGGGAGSGKVMGTEWSAGTYTWNVPNILKGDRLFLGMFGGGGGGGGADQGGGGGGASGGFLDNHIYNVAANKSTISIVVGAGGKGGNYWAWPGTGGSGYKNGEPGAAHTGGGGGGGSTSFDNGAITAFGGGGGAGQCIAANGWHSLNLHTTVFNYGGKGRIGGTCGPSTYNDTQYGGASGGNGGDGGGVAAGLPGQNGTIGTDGRAIGNARGGKGGGGAGDGRGGWGQDYDMNGNGDYSSVVGGGAGGGGGGSAWRAGGSAATTCGSGGGSAQTEAGIGAGGAGASCGWNGGPRVGGDGGSGYLWLRYSEQNYGGTGGQAGKVVPRSRMALTNTMYGGKALTLNLGRGGTGGDRTILVGIYGNNIGTMNKSGIINNSDTTLAAANGQPGTASYITFNGTTIATTGSGSCGGEYQTNNSGRSNCGSNNLDCGTHNIKGQCINYIIGWHGHLAACGDRRAGTQTSGGHATPLEWDGAYVCGLEGGTLGIGSEFNKRNGGDGGVGHGGSGAYYGGYGGKGGDGYVKIEWGIPRNIDGTEALRYSGGGGSAGETITRRITVSPTVNKIRYRIGEGGSGGSFNISNNTMSDGGNGGDTVFGLNGNYGFNTITAKGGVGGKSVRITSAYDSNFIITSLIGSYGDGGIAQCNVEDNCKESMNGLQGHNNKGGKGGDSSTGNGADGGNSNNNNNLNGSNAINLESNGRIGGGAGGGGGASGNNSYGKGGKGANGYIKIEYED